MYMERSCSGSGIAHRKNTFGDNFHTGMSLLRKGRRDCDYDHDNSHTSMSLMRKG